MVDFSDFPTDESLTAPDRAGRDELRYVPNPKHKEPWQRGRRGSLCPPDVSLEQAQALLERSVPDGEKRYAVHEGRAFCAQVDRQGAWHGYPEGWRYVPPKLRRDWVRTRQVTKREIDRFWEREC